MEGPTGTGPVTPPDPPISIDDLLNSLEVIRQKEVDDRTLLETIKHIDLKSKLVLWAIAGFPNTYELHRVVITPPQSCSDGVSRTLADYILFCSGKPMIEHVAPLQEKVTNIQISFANMGTHIAIVVSRV